MIFRLVYDFGIRLYHSAIWIASFWNRKAKDWIEGRLNWQKRLQSSLSQGTRLWIHTSSLGEYEMAKPIIRLLKAKRPDVHIIVSFFSPSGFKNFKDEAGHVSVVFYLPVDTSKNAGQLLEILSPSIIIFIKYEFWPNLLSAITKRKIPFFYVGVVFRSNQWFWRFPGNPVIKTLRNCTAIMVQNQKSCEVAQSYGLSDNVIVTGDTRFDRSREISRKVYENKRVSDFRRNEFTIIVGSSWHGDEEVYIPLLHKYPNWHWIIAPHDVSPSNIQRLQRALSLPVVLFNSTQDDSDDHRSRVMIVNTIGHLSLLYRYGDVALIGGAFGSGLHNILEALAYNIPVMFGPKFQKFWEAEEAVAQKFAHSYSTTEELENWLLHYSLHNNRIVVTNQIQKWFDSYTEASTVVVESILKEINP